MTLLAVLCVLPADVAAQADTAGLSCAEVAERRAAQQYAEDIAALEDPQVGQIRGSALRRDFLRLDAESYRARVYEDCLRRRGERAPAEQPPPSGD